MTIVKHDQRSEEARLKDPRSYWDDGIESVYWKKQKTLKPRYLPDGWNSKTVATVFTTESDLYIFAVRFKDNQPDKNDFRVKRD